MTRLLIVLASLLILSVNLAHSCGCGCCGCCNCCCTPMQTVNPPLLVKMAPVRPPCCCCGCGCPCCGGKRRKRSADINCSPAAPKRIHRALRVLNEKIGNEHAAKSGVQFSPEQNCKCGEMQLKAKTN